MEDGTLIVRMRGFGWSMACSRLVTSVALEVSKSFSINIIEAALEDIPLFV